VIAFAPKHRRSSTKGRPKTTWRKPQRKEGTWGVGMQSRWQCKRDIAGTESVTVSCTY